MPHLADRPFLSPKPPNHTLFEVPGCFALWISPWKLAVCWAAAHGILFWLLADATALLFQNHSRVGKAWGVLLHYALPWAIGLLQTAFICRRIRHAWLWFPATLLGVPLCLILNDGWGVLPVIGFGFGVSQAVLLRPRGLAVCTLWIVASGVGWFLPWVEMPLASPWFQPQAWREFSLETSPVLATAWTGLVYGTLTAPIVFALKDRRGLESERQPLYLDWLTPCGIYLVLIAFSFYAGINFDVLMCVRDTLVAFLVGGSNRDLSRWAEPLSLAPLFLAGEMAHQVLTTSARCSPRVSNSA